MSKTLSLPEAQVEAAALSRKESRKVYIEVFNAEGDCRLVDHPSPACIKCFKNGSEIALPVSIAEAEKPAPRVSKKPAKSSKEDTFLEDLNSDEEEIDAKKIKKSLRKSEKSVPLQHATRHDRLDGFVERKSLAKRKTENESSTKTNKTMTTKAKKSPAKKAAAPVKKTAKKAATRQPAEAVTIIASSPQEAVKKFLAEGHKRGTAVIKGKRYGVTIREGWALLKSVLELGSDGMIMYIKSEKGFYLYPKAAYKEVFGKILASNTYKNIGIYSQSTLPQWHEEYWNDVKK